MPNQESPRGLITFAHSEETAPRIKVIGVGGAGGTAVNRMIEDGIEGVEFIVANTDLQALRDSRASVKIQLGEKLTGGLSARGNPEIGKQAALEGTDKVLDALAGADMVLVAAGLGGGTGTGAAPVVGSLAGELGALTIAVVTKPFRFEGVAREIVAIKGLEELRGCVDRVITIPNERLLTSSTKAIPFVDAFDLADGVLRDAVRGISDIITLPGFINADIPDLKAIMAGRGVALMGIGTASGEDRASKAVQLAVSSPMLDDASIQGATSLLVNVTGSADMTLFEVSEALGLIHDATDAEACLTLGAVIDERLSGEMRITVIATNFAARADASEPVHGRAAMQAPAHTPDEVDAKFQSLLERMQTPEAKRGMKAAFDLSPAQLGSAAVDAPQRAVEEPLDIPAFIKRRA